MHFRPITSILQLYLIFRGVLRSGNYSLSQFAELCYLASVEITRKFGNLKSESMNFALVQAANYL
jgi:hypothetical protein